MKYDENKVIERVYDESKKMEGPFKNSDLPEKKLVDKYDKDVLELLSYGCMLDFNRNASRMWANIEDVYNDNPEIFNPTLVVENYSKEKLSDILSEYGFRYPNRDSKGWFENSKIIYERYSKDWNNLIKKSGKDGERLCNLIKQEDFIFLSGDKLCPFYVKTVHTFHTELSNIWNIPIPVDVHVRNVTMEISEEKIENDQEIRNYWRRKGKNYNIDPTYIDTALWLIGNNWNTWGEEYIQELKEEFST